jgi:DNA-3-methyladenine glycosylase II
MPEPTNIATPATLDRAAEYLSQHDKILRPVIAGAGIPDIIPHREYYRELTESIISQQLSVKAARSIRQRFYDLFGGSFPSPDAILAETPEALRKTGLSNAKVAYIRDLAGHIQDGQLNFAGIDAFENEAVIAKLVAIKGIGEWTAHMFLIFSMGRLDVLPSGDLGIRSGIRKLYGLAALPAPQEIVQIAETNHWHPYESVASWYIWHSLDNMPQV